MTISLTNGDCLKLMKNLPDKSVDLFICDLPYGETNCKWDSVIDLEEFWKEFKRLRKSKRTACIHFCSTKFGYTLIKSNEKMFKMDMVWKKRNKTGGLQSRNRPMRNHEMIYFFYEQAPKYNRDTYHKRIQAVPKFKKDDKNVYGNNKDKNTQGTNSFKPPNPASVLEEKTVWGIDKDKTHPKGNGQAFDPPNPASVIEDKDEFGWDKSVVKEMGNKVGKIGANFEPPNPASVLEEYDYEYNGKKYVRNNKYTTGFKELNGSNFGTYGFDPPNPASVLEEDANKILTDGKYIVDDKVWGWETNNLDKSMRGKEGFKPRQPVSILEEELIEPAEDEPKSMFESKKVFIGKRHHQTEKPLDILEFFIKYWSDEGQTILDPTMGSGSTGVACKTLKRNFIGYEMDEKIFKIAETRIDKVKII